MDRNLFTVGEMSQITGVSKQAIRYYDKIGLLKPGRIDGNNAYRYYEPIHILYLNTIMKLSQLGCSLKEIKQYLSGNRLNEIEDMLKLRKVLVDKKIEELQNASKILESQIRVIETGYNVKDVSGIHTKEIPDRQFVYLSRTEPIETKSVIITISRLVKSLEKHDMIFNGCPVIYLSNKDGKYIFEAGCFYEGNASEGDFEKRVVDRGKYASIYHCGPYNKATETFDRLYGYLDKQHLKPLSGIYQLFIIDYALVKKEEDLLTEIQIKIG